MRHWRPSQTVLGEAGLKDQSSSPKPEPEPRPVAGTVPAGCWGSPPQYTYTYSYSGSFSPPPCGKDNRDQSLDSKPRPWPHPGRQAPPSSGLPVAQAQKLLCVESCGPAGGVSRGPGFGVTAILVSSLCFRLSGEASL